jgi:predicted ATPase
VYTAAMEPLATNLRPLRTPFIGRQQDLLALDNIVQQSPMVTVMGPPGMGKTRISIEYLSSLTSEKAPGGAWFCDLSDVFDEEGLRGAVAKIFSLKHTTSAAISEELITRGRVVLVLDNFEQLTKHAPLLSDWLRDAPGLRLLVTSRERLWIPEESIFDLRPLSLPEPGADFSLEQSEAAQLFFSRAKALNQTIDLDGANKDLLIEIVRRLDGIPLAIELCASRCRLLSLREINESLSERFSLLSSRFIGLPRRQQTLSQAIDWSWELLSLQERAAFCQCSLFEGGFSIEAARFVWRLPDGDLSPIELIESLCDKSLLYRYNPQDGLGAARFGMYQSIKEYAAARLEDRRSLEQRHADFFLQLTAQVEEQKIDGELRKRLERDAENLLAGVRRAMERGERDTALRLLRLLSHAGLSKVPPSRFMPLMEKAVSEATVEPALLASCLNRLGLYQSILQRHEEGLCQLKSALSIAESLSNTSLMEEILYNIGQVMVVLYHPDAEESLLRARQSARQSKNQRIELVSQGYLITLYINIGRLNEAQQLLQEPCLAPPADELIKLWSVARLAIARGDHEQSEQLTERVLKIYSERAYQRGVMLCMFHFGHIKQDQGRPSEAAQQYLRALEIAEGLHEPRAEGLSYGFLGISSLLAQDLVTARRHLLRATSLLSSTSDSAYYGLFTGHLAVVCFLQGKSLEAEGHLHAANASFSRLYVPLFSRCLKLCSLFALSNDDERLQQEIQEQLTAPCPGGLTLIECSPEARALLALLKGSRRETIPIKDEPQPAQHTIQIEERGRWFLMPGAERVSLATRKPLGRMLRALAEARLQKPGSVLSPRRLIEATWPGETIEATSGKNRLYSTLKMLRNIGLREVILQQDDGYLLDPRRAILFVVEEG